MDSSREKLQKCRPCGKRFSSRSKYIKHRKICLIRQENITHTRNDQTVNMTKEKNSKQIENKKESRPTRPSCFVRLERLSNKKIEKYTRTKPLSSSERTEKPETISLVYNCEKCKALFNRNSKLIRHKLDCYRAKTVKPVLPRIKECSIHITRLTSVDIKQATKPTNQDQLCKYCNKNFKNSKKLLKHLKKEHSHKYKCSECSCSSNNRTLLGFHEFTHQMKKYSCDFCPEDFFTKFDLVRHKGECRQVHPEL